MAFLRFRSSAKATSESNETNCVVKDVDALRWKLYGKNKAFHIIQDIAENAATKIQAFWRGSISRAATSEKIQDLIEDITTLRKLEAENQKWDKEDHRKQPERETLNSDQKEEDDEGFGRQSKKIRPWQTFNEGDREHRMANVVTPTRTMSRARKEEEEHSVESDDFMDLFESAEGDTRGYSRYRTNINGKNKTRPWRDDTNVFDAY